MVKGFRKQLFRWMASGLAGLLIAAIFAAAMSSMDTSLNSSATLVLCDIYHRLIRPNAGERFSTDEPKEVIKKPSREIGERLYTSLGCIACHSLDGGKNHGPTLKGSYGSKREFLKASPMVIDEAYIRESIENPMAKTVKGYLTGMMPPYKLQEAEYDSLILFIKSVR